MLLGRSERVLWSESVAGKADRCLIPRQSAPGPLVRDQSELEEGARLFRDALWMPFWMLSTSFIEEEERKIILD